ncbi:dihydrofolate reductase [Rickettsia sp. MEAM1 (Bemisia tabaci)]|uniref:dihydrofolate reductase n=1 Tax=Rickettsia sp. MEAM1 (Bemisia tabaci) TaxID=1182263 RepID=UPI001E5B567E|nr:dihydrofolate reductase [Rickettsia sp. MEAM1 (Bemisia tabaci)]
MLLLFYKSFPVIAQYLIYTSLNLTVPFLLTKINKDYEGDTFFPLDLLEGWDSMMIDKTNDYKIYKFTKH